MVAPLHYVPMQMITARRRHDVETTEVQTTPSNIGGGRGDEDRMQLESFVATSGLGRLVEESSPLPLISDHTM